MGRGGEGSQLWEKERRVSRREEEWRRTKNKERKRKEKGKSRGIFKAMWGVMGEINILCSSRR